MKIDNSKFKMLRDIWVIETKNNTSSNVSSWFTPSYHNIIALKNEAVPCILQELIKEGDRPRPWFSALRMITHVDPVPKEAKGNYVEMAKSWIQWGYDSGLIEPNEALAELKKEIKEKFPEKKEKKEKKLDN